MLEMCGFEVMTAANGLLALTVASEFRPRFVLLDIGLPGLDGNEVARRLRADSAFGASTLIAVTAYADEESRCRSKEAGFDSYLVKPVPLKVLLETLSGFGAESR
jgi:DNA-binding response OmpR family regulator